MNKRKQGRSGTAGKAAARGLAALLFALLLPLAAWAGRSIGANGGADNAQSGSAIDIVLENIDADENVSRSILLELLNIEGSADKPLDLSDEGPTVLIYHTHSTEAYFPTEQYAYTESTPWRTKDSSMNVLALGEKLCTLLNEEYGIHALHDTTDHEPPKLATAYSRSLKTMLEYKQKYPSLEIFIDLHRDAYGNDPQAPADYLTIAGKEYARIMFVVGTGEGSSGSAYDEKPDFQANYALAKTLSDQLCAIHPKLARNIRIKAGRYNQHVSSHCLLAEIGHNANTFEQAMNSIELFAQAIAAAVSGNADNAENVDNQDALPAMLMLVP